MPTRDNPLTRYTETAANGASFLAEREGGLAKLTPLTATASAWLRCSVAEDSSFLGDTLVLEMRYFPALADAIIAAGFTFERDPLSN